MRKVFRDRAAEDSPHRTHDLQPSKHAGVFASEKIGLKRFRTPEGYLFCEDVPIARTDEMIYGPGEVPLNHGSDGLIRVTRDATTLFDLNTLLSYQGKPITNDHPNEDVNPRNWREHSVGVVLNPRRGVGDQADIMLADFLVTDAQAIKDIDDGKVEVSCGYDAMYEQTGPGKGIQTDIVGNHVALVERGRCGPRCAIGDRQLTEEEDEMKTRDNALAPAANETDAAKRIRRQFNDAAEAAIKEAEAANQGVNVHVHLGSAPVKDAAAVEAVASTATDKTQVTLDALIASVAKLTKSVATLAKGKAKDADEGEDDGEAEPAKKATEDAEEEDDEDEGKKKDKETKDSAALATSYQNTLAGAEVLVPGLKTPTFDAAKPRKGTMDALCRIRSTALDRFASTAPGAAVIASLMAGKGYDSLTTDCKATAQLFNSAVAVQKANVNAGMTGGSRQAQQGTHDGQTVAYSPPVHDVASITKRHADFWAKQGRQLSS